MIDFAIRRKTAISMFFLGLSLLGYISYRYLPVELLPSVELPFLIIQVNGARDSDPFQLEREAIIPLEGAVGTLEGIDKVQSYADERGGAIFVYYTTEVDLKYAYLKLQEKVNEVRRTLPEDYFAMVQKVDTEQLSNMFMNLQVRGEGGVDRVRHLVDTKITPDLEAIDGIASVQVFGGREKSVEIIIQNESTDAYGISPSDIRAAIARYNQYKTYVGHIRQPDQVYYVNVVAEYSSVWDLENIVIEPSVPVLLKDIATIRVGVKEETSYSRVNGKEAVTVQLVRDAQVNLLALAENTYPVIERLNREMASEGLEIVIESDSAEYLRENIDLIINLALTGGLLAVLILWFFLQNLRLIAVIALSLPISVLTAFNFFYAFDITLNSLTLIGMALAVGMLLDNSIVVLENVYRLVQQGAGPFRAALEGTREVWRSIAAATLTTITVFLPFVFATNFMVRILGYQIGVSIISTLLISLLVALLLIPMVTHHFLKRRDVALKPFYHFSRSNRLVHIYLVLLKSAMRFPVRTVVVTLVIFFASLLAALALSLSGEQEAQQEDLTLYVTMPSGATLATTDQAVSEIEAGLEDIPEFESIVSQVYEEDAVLTLKLKEDFEDIRRFKLSDVKGDVNQRVEDYRAAEIGFDPPASSRRFRGGGGGGGQPGGGLESLFGMGGQPERVVIKGRNIELMRKVADDIEFQLEELASVERAWVNAAGNRPELHLLPDKTLLSEYRIDPGSVRNALSTFQPETSSGIKFKDGTDEYDILIRNESYEEQDVDDLRNLDLQSQNGGSYPLSQVSDVLYAEGNSGIERLNQERLVEVSYRFRSEISGESSFLQAARDEIDQLIANFELPAGLAIEVVHDETDWSEFYFFITVAFILIFMILASVFESLLYPLIIMFTIPLAAVGSLIAIILTGHSILNASTLIGMLILLGIVVNNGIILIDYTGQLRRRGYRYQRALIVAGLARLRPILITAITTIVAMVPMAMGKVEYVTQIAAPFAITVIGGLSMSTVFTLILIPTVYSGLESALAWLRGLGRPLQLLQAGLFIAAAVLIYYGVESLLWQFANLLLALLAIPGLTYFVLNSLRQARAEVIPAGAPIRIQIHQLFKIYDYPGRFRREWQKYDRETAGGDRKPLFSSWRDLRNGVWHFLLLGFLIYFVYFYLGSRFWQFILAHPVYFYAIYLVNQLGKLPGEDSPGWRGKLRRWLPALLIWGLPAVNLLVFFRQWHNLAWVAIVAAMWYGALMVYFTSNRLSRQLVDINRISGRFSGIRKRFYRLIQAIPVLGKRQKPFSALKGVSLTIESGMFGLLGPNGAGKTTLMRIICGILEQSYGAIYINDINVKQQREEVQGLIGYLPQDFGTYENMSAYEFLNYQAILKNITDRREREARIRYVLESVHLEASQHQKIGAFSGGMKQRVGIAQTLLHLPRILVVDEPTAGLDPRERIRFRNLLVELSRERVVIFSTHVIEDIASSCDKVALLHRGELCYLGKPQEMAGLAEGHVWQFLIDPEELDAVRQSHNVVHHLKVGERIRVRCLAANAPRPGAQAIRPTLEDAYLWTIQGASASVNGNGTVIHDGEGKDEG